MRPFKIVFYQRQAPITWKERLLKKKLFSDYKALQYVSMIIIIYTDGAARGNPGPASLGVVIQADKEHQYRQYLGIATNNQAEYKALIFALKKVHQLIQEQNLEVDKIVCYSDSELLVRQMKSEYKVKNRSLAPLFAKAWNLAQQFKTVVFMRIPREENQTADKLANKAIDQHLKSDY